MACVCQPGYWCMCGTRADVHVRVAPFVPVMCLSGSLAFTLGSCWTVLPHVWLCACSPLSLSLSLSLSRFLRVRVARCPCLRSFSSRRRCACIFNGVCSPVYLCTCMYVSGACFTDHAVGHLHTLSHVPATSVCSLLQPRCSPVGWLIPPLPFFFTSVSFSTCAPFSRGTVTRQKTCCRDVQRYVALSTRAPSRQRGPPFSQRYTRLSQQLEDASYVFEARRLNTFSGNSCASVSQPPQNRCTLTSLSRTRTHTTLTSTNSPFPASTSDTPGDVPRKHTHSRPS